MAKRSPLAQKRKLAKEHRAATCDYRFVWRIAPEHQRAGWRRAALTHESLTRAYVREIKAMEPLL